MPENFNQQSLIKSFLSLVKISSESKDEFRVIAHLKKELEKLGASSYEDNAAKKIGGNAGNLFCRIKGNVKNAPTIMLNAHVDTVLPGKNIKPIIKGDIVRSSGKTVLGADDKAGVAVILEVIRFVLKNNIPHGDMLVVFTVAEEIGILGSRCMDKKYLKADFGYVLDGGLPHKIINAAPSQINITAKIIGKAAHAGTHPEDGINAIKIASAAIASMKLGRIDFETTANIGVIQGGIATNIVPPETAIKGEARSHNLAKLKKQIQHMRACLKKAAQKYKGKAEIKLGKIYDSFKIDKNKLFVRAAVSAVKKQGLKPAVVPSGGGSDANIFNVSGVPSIILGVGAQNLHTTDEYVRVSDMAKAAAIVLQIIKNVAYRRDGPWARFQ